MILVLTQNSLAFDEIKNALIAQHGMMHVKSHNYPTSAPSQPSYRGWNKGKGRGKNFTRHGYVADSYDDRDLDEAGYYDYEETPEAYTVEGQWCDEQYYDTEEAEYYDDDYDDDYDVEDDTENDVQAYLVHAADNEEYDWEDEDTNQAFADAMQYSEMAYIALDRFKGKSRGKGPSKGKRTFGSTFQPHRGKGK